MRLVEFTKPIVEVKMSPDRLALAATDVNALVGIEFEMNVPLGNQEDVDPVPDMGEDIKTNSIDRICDFFETEENDSKDIRRLRTKLEHEYEDWASAKMEEMWRSEEYQILYDHYESTGEYDSEDELKRAVQYAQRHEPPEFNELHDSYIEKYIGLASEYNWLKETYPKMSDIFVTFDINWPYVTFPETSPTSLKEIANEFSNMIGMKVNWSESYHGAKRTDNAYALEPDSSVESNDDNMTGLEFISPPLPLETAIQHLLQIRTWARNKGCETNKSTGLHINCSIKNRTGQELDYIKMALFLGDNYILDQFNRIGNVFAKSAFEIIKNKVAQYPTSVNAAFDYMRQGLNHKASNIIHDNATNKHTSINIKDDGAYLEIRSPGGDWLNEDMAKLRSTLYRIVVATDIAYDENKYKREYTTKLYKMLASNQSDRVTELFIRYSTGEITSEQLKLYWAKYTDTRPATAKKQQLVSKFLSKEKTWKVKHVRTGKIAIVSAMSEEEAFEKGKEELIKRYIAKQGEPITSFQITVVDPNASPPAGKWGRWIVTLGGGQEIAISARNEDEANDVAALQFPQYVIDNIRYDNS